MADLATIDDLTSGPIAALNFVPITYKNLNFQAFIFQSAGTANVAPGVVPHSQTNAGNPILTAEGTDETSFDLKSF
ncbi:hypothetical protein MMC21_000098 [Puttea exsequens]|nr:hypothetical protein [Puttea exsequens]